MVGPGSTVAEQSTHLSKVQGLNPANRTAGIRCQSRKTTVFSCHVCLIKTGVEKNKQHVNMDFNFDHQMSLSESKCWY